MNFKNNYNPRFFNDRYRVYGEIFFVNKEFSPSKQMEAKSPKNKEKDKYHFFDNSIKESIISKIESIPLLFNKYVPAIDSKIQDLKNNKEEVWYSLSEESIGGDSKKLFLLKFIEISKSQNNIQVINNFYNKFKERIENQNKSLKEIGYEEIFNGRLKKDNTKLYL